MCITLLAWKVVKWTLLFAKQSICAIQNAIVSSLLVTAFVSLAKPVRLLLEGNILAHQNVSLDSNLFHNPKNVMHVLLVAAICITTLQNVVYAPLVSLCIATELLRAINAAGGVFRR